MRKLLVAVVLLVASLGAAAPARAEGDEARDRAACAGGSARLRVEAEDGRLHVELRLDARPGVRTFRVVLLHERTLVVSGLRRTTAAGTFRVRLTLPDWPGRETVSARLVPPSGRACLLSVTL